MHAAVQAASCALQRRRAGFVAGCVLALIFAAPGPLAATPLAPAFGTPPLAGPVRLTDPFGELRGSHLHAGLDLRAAVGTPVRAPARASLERVRASGGGYGRSLYLRTESGERIVFAHLDAFAPAVAAFVDSVQRASGAYEQDLWPEAGRFAFAEGDTVAWSGESGAGPPHLHVEVRHGDFALNPLRAGWPLPDDEPPTLESLVLEPMDGASGIEGRPRPWRTVLPAAAETLTVAGRVRASVRARDRIGGADGYAWSTGILWRGERVEARLDSISWAGEMAELDWMVDRGQVLGARGLLLWAPAGWRPRLLRTSRPVALEAGTIELRPGEGPLELQVTARDVAGNHVTRSLWLRGAAPESAWAAAVRSPAPADTAAGAWLALPGADLGERLPGPALPREVTYEPVHAALLAPARTLREGDRIVSAPRVVALRAPLRLVVDAGGEAARPGWGLVHRAFPDEGGSWTGLTPAPGGRLWTEVTRLGEFTLMRDVAPPVVGVARVADRLPSAHASRWSLEVPVGDARSGIDARASHLVVNGVRVPTEHDADARVLRWRPLARPREQVFVVEAVAVDRAGLRTRRGSRVVLDSAPRR